MNTNLENKNIGNSTLCGAQSEMFRKGIPKHFKKTVHITKKVIHIKLSILILLLLPLVVATLITSNSDIIAGVRSMVVLSGSMTPNIPVGSVVYVQKDSSYTTGDVISFKNDGGITVTHRVADVIQENGVKYQTKGDANDVVDNALVLPNQIIGKSVFVIPHLGYAINFVQSPLGFVMTIIIPSLIFIGFELWNIKKEIEKSVEKRILERMGSI